MVWLASVVMAGNSLPEEVLFQIALDMDAKSLIQFSKTDHAAHTAFQPIFEFKNKCGIPISST